MSEDNPRRAKRRKNAGGDGDGADGGGGPDAKKIIIGAGIAALVLGLGGGVGGFFVAQMLAPPPPAAPVAAEALGPDGQPAEVEEEKSEYLVYASVGKLLATVENKGATRYIQAEVDLGSYNKKVIDDINHDMPAIRNRLLMLFSSQSFDEMRTVEGRENLRLSTVDAVNEVLGKTAENGVAEAFFTAFVIQ